MSRFESDTAVERRGGRAAGAVAGDVITYDGVIDPSWWVVMGPNGGYIAAIAARAVIDAAGGPGRRLHSLTVQYLRPPVEGPCTVEVRVERVGRGVSSVTFRMFQERGTVVTGVAALAVVRSSITVRELSMPDAPLPADVVVPPFPDGFTPIPMSQHFDNVPVFGTMLGTGEASGVARTGGWLRLAEPTPVDEVVLVAFCDGWWPPIMELGFGPMAVPTVDLTVHVRALPEDRTDFVLGEFISPMAADGYVIEDARLWSRGGALLAESRQLAVLM